MSRFYQPDMAEHIDSPFVRDGADKLVRRSYWLDMDDRTLHGDGQRHRRKSDKRGEESTFARPATRSPD